MTGFRHFGFQEPFLGAPLNPSHLRKEIFDDGYEDWQLHTLAGAFAVSFTGSYLHAAGPDMRGAVIIPWRDEHLDIAATIHGDTASYEFATIILRFVDPENYLLLRVQALGGPDDGLVTLHVIEDNTISFGLAYWPIPDTDTVDGLEIKVNLSDGFIRVWADNTELSPEDGGGLPIPTPHTTMFQGATAAGFELTGTTAPIGFNHLTMQVFGASADNDLGYPTNLTIHPHAPVSRPTLTAGGDTIEITAGTAVAQLVAQPAHLKLRHRAVSVGTPAAPTDPLQGVLQPVAGSLDGDYGNTDGTGAGARFNLPYSLRVYDNTLYVADYGNRTVRAIALNGPLPAPVTTLLSTDDVPIYGDPDSTLDGRPVHLDIDPDSDKMLVVCDTYIADVAHVSEPDPQIEAIRGGTTFGSATLLAGGAEAVVKYPLGDFTNGWWRLTVVSQGPKNPRGTLTEPGPPDQAFYCDPPINAIVPITYYWRDGAYAGDGGVVTVANRYADDLPAVVITHSYHYPSHNGLGLSGGAAPHRPYTACTPIPPPPEWPPPAGNFYLRGPELLAPGVTHPGVAERELVRGPDDVLNGGLPTVVGSLPGLDLGVIQKYTIDAARGSGDDFVVSRSMDHSKGLAYLPTRSVAYNENTGIYYLTIGETPDSNAVVLGWATNRIVALDLYAPDYVTGELGLPTVSPYAERIPDPIDTLFTPAETGELTAIRLVIGSAGGSARLPIGIAAGGAPSAPADEDTWIDEDGTILTDEDGNPLLLD